ncbi:hypothetical protein D3C78_966890 [compost metagenome]
MRELLYEIKQSRKGRMRNNHRLVNALEDDAVLVVIHIRRVLEIPLFTLQLKRQYPKILTGRMIRTACISYIFCAKQALGILRLRHRLKQCDLLRVLLRLREINGDLKLAEFGRMLPVQVLSDTIHSNVIGIYAQPVESIGRSLQPFLLCLAPECGMGFRGTGHEQTHNPSIQQIAIRRCIIRYQADGKAVIKKLLKQLHRTLKLLLRHIPFIGLGKMKLVQKRISRRMYI